MKKWPVLIKLSFPQRKNLSLLIGSFVILIAFFYIGFDMYRDTMKRKDDIESQTNNLSRYERNLQQRKTVEEGLQRTIKQYDAVQQRLLAGETPELGAATLQEIVKRLSEKNGISIRSFRMLDPKDIDSYRKISLLIDFNPSNSMLGLGQFLYDIEHYEKELMISEMDMQVFNFRTPVNIQGSLLISGWMKNTRPKEKGRAG
jgi:hypothetical protein